MIRRNEMLTKIDAIKKLSDYVAIQDSSSLSIDAGANVGDFTSDLLNIFPELAILAFEPTTTSADIYRNRFTNQKNVQLLELALTSYEGTSTFYINANDKTNSILPRPKSGKIYYGKKAVTINQTIVNTIDLDSVIYKNYPNKHISLVKLDLQGGELEALKGMKKLLSLQQIDIIVSEAMFIEHYESQPLFKDIWNYLTVFDYSLYDLVDVSWMIEDGQIRQGDAIFISNKVRRIL